LEANTVVEHESADAFLAKCATWLSKNEGLNHGLLSLADTLRSNRHIHEPPFYFFHIANRDKLIGCAILAEPDGLVLSEMDSDTSAALFSFVHDKISIPSRIFGPIEPAIRLAEIFAEASNHACELNSRWRVHRLDKLCVQKYRVSGQLVLGTMDDQGLVSSWGRKYDEEKPANVNIEKFLLRKLEDRLLYFWTDGEPKALATLSGTICKGPRISAVYTPRLLRGNGYAFALAHKLSKQYLDSGSSYITLNTQEGDPVERMYAKIGYRVIGEKACIGFRPTQ
jgi:predicted GNAT family acetyltransferase